MKKPHVLNRPMFNKGGTSAYGRGIASNLVTDEQRQRFNYGGRVGLAQGTGFFNFAPSNVENIQRLPTGEIDYDFYEKEDLKVPTTWGEKILPHSISGYDLMGIPKSIGKWPYKLLGGEEGDITNLYGAEEKEKAKFERERKIRKRKERLEGPGIWGSSPSKKDAEKSRNKLDDIMAAADAEEAAAKAKAEAKAKEVAAAEANKDPNVIDLTDSERAGLKATLYAGAGAGALDPSNKTVTDVIRSALLGANKAGKEIYDPTTERKYRKYAEAHTNIQDEAFKRKIKWETSDEKLMTDRAATLGKQGAEEEKAVGKQVPKTGSGAEYKTIKKSITESEKKGTPLAGQLVFDTDIQKYMVWDAQRKKYIHVSGNIDKVQKVLTKLGG